MRAELLQDGGPRGSGEKSPADAEAEDLLHEALTEAFPEFGFLAEERPERNTPAGPGGYLWAVDPNDGTGPFLSGWRGAAVSVGLLRHGEPVLGVVYAYALPTPEKTGELGDLVSWAEGNGGLRRNGEPFLRGVSRAVVLVSHKADRRSRENAECCAPLPYRAAPSIAWRLALVALGEGRAAMSIYGPDTYDLAGGHALLRGAGLEAIGEDGGPIRYGADGSSSVTHFFGGEAPVVEALRNRPWDKVKGSAPASAAEGELDLVLPRKGQSEADTHRLLRAQGCLLGQLAGDALGALVEFETPDRIAERFPGGGPFELAAGGTWNTLPGQPTDDSEMALALARTLLRDGVFGAEAAAESYRRWLESMPFDCGNTVRTALSGLEPNIESQANGALMRISPLGIFGHAAPASALAEWARADAAITHPHPFCQDANAVFAVTLGRAIQVGGSPEGIFEFARRYAEAEAPEVAELLAEARSGPPRSYTHHMGWVRIALHNAFFQLLHADSLEAGIVETVRGGGDTDTNAAIAGALLGAVYGAAKVPEQWISALYCCRPIDGIAGVNRPRPRAYWPVDVMVVAERLLFALGAE